MTRHTRAFEGKAGKRKFFVFCEGETEIAYVMLLRAMLRSSVRVIPRKSDSNISDQYIENCKRDYKQLPDDQTFAMFDLDIDGMFERLSKLKNVTLLVSNPCLELWFLFHNEDCTAEISSAECVKRLKQYQPDHVKGSFTETLKNVLESNYAVALERAQKLKEYEDPSSTVYKLIESMAGK